MNELHKLHALALRTASGAIHSTPVHALEVLLGVQPFKDRMDQASARLLSRTIRLPQSHPQRQTMRQALSRYATSHSHTYLVGSPFNYAKRVHVNIHTWETEINGPTAPIEANICPVPSPSMWHDLDDPDWQTILDNLDTRDTIVYTGGSAINVNNLVGVGVRSLLKLS